MPERSPQIPQIVIPTDLPKIVELDDVPAALQSANERLAGLDLNDRESVARFVADASATFIELDARLKTVSEYFDPDIKRAHELHASQLEKKKVFFLPLANAKQLISNMVLTGKRRIEQWARDDAAEIDRQNAAKAAEAAATEAAAAITRNEPEVAQAIIKEAEKPLPPTPIARSVVPMAAGAGSQKRWKARITDKLAAIKFLIATKARWEAYGDLINLDEVALNQRAVRLKSSDLAIPGVEGYQDESLTSRGSRGSTTKAPAGSSFDPDGGW